MGLPSLPTFVLLTLGQKVVQFHKPRSQASLIFVCLFAFGIHVVHRSGRVTKNGKGLGLFIMWTTSGGREMDIGWRGPTAKTTHWQAFYRSSGLQMLAWLKLLILTGKNSLMSIVHTYLNICPSPYVHLGSTHTMNETTFPVCLFVFFSVLQLPCFTLNAKWRTKNGRHGNEANVTPTHFFKKLFLAVLS